jgi:hypothetical protein
MEVLVSEQAWVDNKRKNRMAAIDSLPPELRALVGAALTPTLTLADGE